VNRRQKRLKDSPPRALVVLAQEGFEKSFAICAHDYPVLIESLIKRKQGFYQQASVRGKLQARPLRERLRRFAWN
jgi:hypothetical protein